MAPKSKGGTKAKATESKEPTPSTSTAPPPPPRTPNERSWQIYYATNPYQKEFEELGPHGMSPAAHLAHTYSEYVKPGAADILSKKAQKELWKQASELNLPLRKLPRPQPFQFGRDKHGRDRGDYTLEEFDAYRAKRHRLTGLEGRSDVFRNRRARQAHGGVVDWETGEKKDEAENTITKEDIEEEKARRREMANIRNDLFGQKTASYALDPEWDDVVPIPQDEPEGALAAIAYPDDFAESMAYLRAVMAAKEHSPRALQLTDHIISMNPAHYTVWLYRFAIISALNISIPDEIAWLNEVSLEHLKNYQIWNHRQLLLDHYYPAIVASESDESDAGEAVRDLARSESDFIAQMLALDAKNYHVWSYRQYLVRKLGQALWPSAELKAKTESPPPEDEEAKAAAGLSSTELRSVGQLLNHDVRNNSAWSHRFFVVFSDPGHSTPGSHATETDPAVPAAIVDREIAYARAKIALAPQNQSPWNYLRGVLVKGGRPLGEARAIAESYVENLGKGVGGGEEGAEEGEGEAEAVRSSHALDLLSDIYKEAGERERADLCLKRLAEKWDPIRRGYWEYRRKLLGA